MNLFKVVAHSALFAETVKVFIVEARTIEGAIGCVRSRYPFKLNVLRAAAISDCTVMRADEAQERTKGHEQNPVD
jgi:hypothetical protein